MGLTLKSCVAGSETLLALWRDFCADRMAHATEILLQVSRKHLRWKELPTHVVYSDYSSAKGQGAGNAFNILWDLLLGQWI